MVNAIVFSVTISIVSVFLERYEYSWQILQLFFIFGNYFIVAGRIKKEDQKKMERKEVVECEMIA